MKTRMVILGALWLASALAADEPAKTITTTPVPAPETQAQLAAKQEADAKTFGVTVAELKRLRDYGFSDAELMAQIRENKRTARDLINERVVVDELAKALYEVNQRVYQMPEEKQASEREKALKDAVARLRRERRTSREELRQILSKTSFLRDDQLKRVVR